MNREGYVADAARDGEQEGSMGSWKRSARRSTQTGGVPGLFRRLNVRSSYNGHCRRGLASPVPVLFGPGSMTLAVAISQAERR